MAHTPLAKQFIQILQKARRAKLLAKGLPEPMTREQFNLSRRQFLKSAAIAGLATTGIPGTLRQALAYPGSHSVRIAIIGGGLAGLNAAYQLKKTGLRSQIYEASNRLGGSNLFSQTSIR